MPSQEFVKDWPLTPITDPEESRRIDEETGFVPYSEEKQAWVSKCAIKLYHENKPFSTFELAKEYDRRKADGTLNDVFK